MPQPMTANLYHGRGRGIREGAGGLAEGLLLGQVNRGKNRQMEVKQQWLEQQQARQMRQDMVNNNVKALTALTTRINSASFKALPENSPHRTITFNAQIEALNNILSATGKKAKQIPLFQPGQTIPLPVINGNVKLEKILLDKKTPQSQKLQYGLAVLSDVRSSVTAERAAQFRTALGTQEQRSAAIETLARPVEELVQQTLPEQRQALGALSIEQLQGQVQEQLFPKPEKSLEQIKAEAEAGRAPETSLERIEGESFARARGGRRGAPPIRKTNSPQDIKKTSLQIKKLERDLRKSGKPPNTKEMETAASIFKKRHSSVFGDDESKFWNNYSDFIIQNPGVNVSEALLVGEDSEVGIDDPAPKEIIDKLNLLKTPEGIRRLYLDKTITEYQARKWLDAVGFTGE